MTDARSFRIKTKEDAVREAESYAELTVPAESGGGLRAPSRDWIMARVRVAFLAGWDTAVRYLRADAPNLHDALRVLGAIRDEKEKLAEKLVVLSAALEAANVVVEAASGLMAAQKQAETRGACNRTVEEMHAEDWLRRALHIALAPRHPGHMIGDVNCRVGECLYSNHARADGLRKHSGCDGVMHILASDWSDYSFGHAGGPVYFRSRCDKCGAVETDQGFREQAG